MGSKPPFTNRCFLQAASAAKSSKGGKQTFAALRSIGSLYVKADIWHHLALSIAANGSKEPTLPIFCTAA
jgi:hypothetical protein